VDDMIVQHARIARSLGEQLELPVAVLDSLGSAYEQWDGKGWPGERAGPAVPLPARIASVAEFTEVAHRLGGVAAVRELVRRRAGGQFDPALADLVDRHAEQIYAGVDGAGTWSAVIDAEPALAVTVEGDAFDRALTAIANFVDLKSPYTLGHSVAVAQLVRAAGEQLGLDHGDVRTLERAALVHEFGRLGVSNAIWDRPGPLGAGAWERVRLYPHVTERMLHQADALAPITRIAVQVQERLDGSGYPRGLRGATIGSEARVLAAADVYQALREPRAHRPAWEPATAAALLRREAQAGRIDGDAAEAVLAAAGHRVRRRREGPAGLTAREVEVLRLLAQGLSNKEIAQRLVISPKTAGTHIEHIYAKIDASSRATASVFAVQHGLLPEEQFARADT
jgi:HD-GYP domain-containing protein (c-di-GMP phosphodiesterase class II)